MLCLLFMVGNKLYLCMDKVVNCVVELVGIYFVCYEVDYICIMRKFFGLEIEF